MHVCHKLNSKLLRDSGFVYRVLASLTKQIVLRYDMALFVGLLEPGRQSY